MSPEVSFEEFTRIDLRVGKVLEASRVPNSKRLIRLKIEIGNEVKQAIAGIGEHYSPEDLQSKQLAVITNLKKRKIMGLDSEVMILAAVEDNSLSIMTPDRSIKTGARIT